MPMEFRTKVELPVGQGEIRHSDPILLWGSCFAENIGKLLTDNKFRCDVNPFGVEALIAAYNEGEEWLEELNQYLFANYHYLRAYFDEYLPEFPVLPLQPLFRRYSPASLQ